MSRRAEHFTALIIAKLAIPFPEPIENAGFFVTPEVNARVIGEIENILGREFFQIDTRRSKRGKTYCRTETKFLDFGLLSRGRLTGSVAVLEEKPVAVAVS